MLYFIKATSNCICYPSFSFSVWPDGGSSKGAGNISASNIQKNFNKQFITELLIYREFLK